MIGNFNNNGSVCTLQNIERIALKVAKHQLFLQSSYIRLAKPIEDEKAVLIIQNHDLKCFTWCLLAHQMKLPRNKNPFRDSKYEPYEHLVKLRNLKYPVTVNDIPTIVKLNDLSINVFAVEDK